MGVAGYADVGFLDQIHHLAGMSLIICSQSSTMACRDTSVVTFPHRLHSEVLQGATHRIVRVVDQHMDVLVVFLRKLKAEVDVRSCILVKPLKPWQTTYDIGSYAHRLLHKQISTWIPH